MPEPQDSYLGALSAAVQQFVHRAFDDARADRAQIQSAPCREVKASGLSVQPPKSATAVAESR